MIRCQWFTNYGDHFIPDYDSCDPVASHEIPGDSAEDVIAFFDVFQHEDYAVYFPDLIVTDTSVCIWSVE